MREDDEWRDDVKLLFPVLISVQAGSPPSLEIFNAKVKTEKMTGHRGPLEKTIQRSFAIGKDYSIDSSKN